jgi:hypothetical protein
MISILDPSDAVDEGDLTQEIGICKLILQSRFGERNLSVFKMQTY